MEGTKKTSGTWKKRKRWSAWSAADSASKRWNVMGAWTRTRPTDADAGATPFSTRTRPAQLKPPVDSSADASGRATALKITNYTLTIHYSCQFIGMD